MDSKVAKTQTVLIKLDCKNNTRSFSCPVNVTMDRVDGLYVSQIIAAAPNAETGVYSVNTDLVTDGNIAIVSDMGATTPNTYFKMSGQTINGNYTFRVDDVQSSTVATALVIGILLTFVKFS